MWLYVPCFFSFLRFLFCLCFLHHLAVSLHFNSSKLQPLCHDNERSALLQFKQSFHFGKDYCFDDLISYNPKVESWKLEGGNSSSADCCSWDGVKCDEETGHVIKLDLSSSCLYGSINSTNTLFNLVHLQWLSLANNDFHSEIPATINNLSRLTHLDLSWSTISGQIPPQLLDLHNLVSLDLSHNSFIHLPGNETRYLELREPSLQNLVEKLTNLKVLNLDEVNISSPIPHMLANLSSLNYLSLQHCGLQGEFPTKIFQLPNLSVLQLTGNCNLTGYLPEFERSSPLTVLAIGSCGFLGTIPSSLGNLTKLVHLDVSFNSFLGELPISIGNLGSLKELDLHGCNFSSGQISSSLGNLTQLNYLDLSHSHNVFSGQNSSSLSWIAKNTKLKFLYLSDLNLVGVIPLWLINLTQLTGLEMSQNQLTGPISSCLMNINQLSYLYLQSNQLTKHIPSEISNLTQLVDLDLSSNSLQGPIPRTIFEFKNLQYLMLQSNNLSGTVEFDLFLSQLESLQVLILSSNNLNVFMNNTVANTNSQKFLGIGLRSCNLSNFPNFLRNQDLLRVLDLSSNSITGKIPVWILNYSMPYLIYLNLSHNLFTEFDLHPNVRPSFLMSLDVRYNKLEGPLPLIPLMFMSEYLVSNNKLTGEISPLICKSKHLYALDLSNNNLSGVLPQCLANFSDALSILALQSNKFHGSIPQTFMKGNNLKMIDLSNNQLQGRIPRSLVNCTNLEYFHLGNNQISDIFPSWLGTLPELKILILKSNRLHGVIKEPEVNFEFHKLQVIDLSHNIFRGELPTKLFQSLNVMKVVNGSHLSYMHDEIQPALPFVGYASYDISDYAYSMRISNKGIELNYVKISNKLNSIILSGNKFEGEIPASIASLRGLQNLNLSHNNLEGHIPSCLDNLTALESLDLSSNRLSGYIPQQLVEITFLEVFNVSYNHLIGLIPQGKQFDTFENSSYQGNPGLCGKPLSKHCETSKPSKKENKDSESPFVFGWKIVLIGFASGLIVGVVLGQEFYTRKHEWLVKIFGMESMKRRRGRKN